MIDSEYGDDSGIDDSGIDDEFVEKFQSGRADDGYGMLLDKGTQERREMANEFNGVEAGDPMDEPDVQASALAPMAEPEDGGIDAAPAAADDASVVVGAPIAAPEIAAAPLPALDESEKPAPGTGAAETKTFGQAFKQARASGQKSFKWLSPKTGKMEIFSTALKSERPRSVPAAPKDVQEDRKTDAAIATEVFQQPDAAPKPRPPLKESTSGIGPKLTGMLPRPGARNIYEGAGVTLADPDKRAKPMTVTGKDSQQRTAESMADLMASRKAEIAARNKGGQGV